MVEQKIKRDPYGFDGRTCLNCKLFVKNRGQCFGEMIGGRYFNCSRHTFKEYD
jgi:hypothetical protein